MADLSYCQPGLTLQQGSPNSQQVSDLQHDLRSLGYLREGIDGDFGPGTANAVMALQYDLLNNQGNSTGSDGNAPVAVAGYNQGRVTGPTGQADQNTVACISDMLDDANFSKLPSSANPSADNATAVAAIAASPPTAVPIPFLLGILLQESGLKHFCVPQGNDRDSFIVLGCDLNAGEPYIITSRGYGVGQYTLFHHPPRPEEVAQIMQDPVQNVSMAVAELNNKFQNFVNGATSGLQADDRQAEYGNGPLRMCAYAATDPNYMSACQQCTTNAGLVTINAGDPVFIAASLLWATSPPYYASLPGNVPVRAQVPCDWAYAARRYNGSGLNSYHYQARILQNVLNFTVPPAASAGGS